MSKFEEIKKGVYAGIINNSVAIVLQILTIPIVIKYWGLGLYGEWLLISSIALILSLIDFGIGVVSGNLMTIEVQRKNYRNAITIFQSVLLSTTVLIVIFGVASELVIKNYNLYNFFKIQLINQSDFNLIISVIIIYNLTGVYTNLIESGFRCDGNYPEGTILLAALRASEQIVMIVTVIFGFELFYIAVSMLTTRSIGLTLLTFRLTKKSKWLIIGISNYDFCVIKKIVIPGLAYIGFNVGNMINQQGIILIIGRYFSSETIAIYSVIKTLSKVINIPITIMNNALWPKISNIYSIGKLEELKDLHRRILKISLASGTIILIVISALSKVVLIKWTSGTIDPSYYTVALIMTGVLINSLWNGSLIFQLVSNSHTKSAFLFGFITILFLLIILKSNLIKNLNDILIAQIVAETLILITILQASIKKTKDNWYDFFSGIVKMKI